MLSGKKIILGITGSIAAYKSAFLTRALIKSGAEVKVIMTSDATFFITPLTLSTLSKNPVHIDFFDKEGAEWNNHVEMGLWADAMIIAPATANSISKMVSGAADNLLIATYLSAKCPVYIAPAMDLDMWKHPSTVSNIQKLESFGNKIIPVGYGELASGLEGEGRMAEPDDIVAFIEEELTGKKKLKDKKIVITAGPTQEAIDPVRYISNHSSGKMGVAIADAAADAGAEVILILGPASVAPKNKNVKVIVVTSAGEMFTEADKYFKEADIFIGAAAVADFTPENYSSSKVKKGAEEEFSISLKKTKDIIKELGHIKKGHQTMVGFALETDNESANAQKKLKEKNLDFIILNSLKDEGSGFQHDTNKITIYNNNNKVKEYQLKPKQEVARDIIDYLIEYINA